jgi:hypothetical protein
MRTAVFAGLGVAVGAAVGSAVEVAAVEVGPGSGSSTGFGSVQPLRITKTVIKITVVLLMRSLL